jgi:uncharacterized OB-fold protein
METQDFSRQPWRVEANGRLRLLATRLRGKLHFPPLPASSPLNEGHELVALGEQATLYSYTIVHTGAKGGKPPVNLALADFPDGVRVFGRLLGERRPVIGEALRVELTETEEGPIYAFRAIETPAP